jgi:ATP-dependent DNA ligase
MLPLRQPFLPMEAKSVEQIPIGGEWQYEPKWDGFRCLIFRHAISPSLSKPSAE